MLNIYCLLENRVAVEIEVSGTEEWFTNQSSIIELIQADCIVNKLKIPTKENYTYILFREKLKWKS